MTTDEDRSPTGRLPTKPVNQYPNFRPRRSLVDEEVLEDTDYASLEREFLDLMSAGTAEDLYGRKDKP